MKNGTPFRFTQPCADCPFRKVGAIELKPGRLAEIVRRIRRTGESFPCHTWFYAKAKRRREPCAGAIIYLEKLGEANQLMQVMDRLRVYPREEFLRYRDEVIEPL
jgi:hypothetical protein